MDRNAIATIAKGLAPLVREVVAPLEARVAAFETLPPELAEQIASAVRMLHESSAIEQREGST